MSKFIVVEGNIGTGKSTLLPNLVKELNMVNGAGEWVELQEPVEDKKFAELLDKFYKDPTPENRIKFQMYITERRHKVCKKLPKKKNYILERSLLSDIIFSQANFLSMEQPDASYMSYFYDIKNKLDDYPKLDMCIYLKADPEISYERVCKRGREAEIAITMAYMEDIHMFHEACLPQICRKYDVPLFTYNWNGATGIERQIMVDDILDNVVFK